MTPKSSFELEPDDATPNRDPSLVLSAAFLAAASPSPRDRYVRRRSSAAAAAFSDAFLVSSRERVTAGRPGEMSRTSRGLEGSPESAPPVTKSQLTVDEGGTDAAEQVEGISRSSVFSWQDRFSGKTPKALRSNGRRLSAPGVSSFAAAPRTRAIRDAEVVNQWAHGSRNSEHAWHNCRLRSASDVCLGHAMAHRFLVHNGLFSRDSQATHRDGSSDSLNQEQSG